MCEQSNRGAEAKTGAEVKRRRKAPKVTFATTCAAARGRAIVTLPASIALV